MAPFRPRCSAFAAGTAGPRRRPAAPRGAPGLRRHRSRSGAESVGRTRRPACPPALAPCDRASAQSGTATRRRWSPRGARSRSPGGTRSPGPATLLPASPRSPRAPTGGRPRAPSERIPGDTAHGRIEGTNGDRRPTSADRRAPDALGTLQHPLAVDLPVRLAGELGPDVVRFRRAGERQPAEALLPDAIGEALHGFLPGRQALLDADVRLDPLSRQLVRDSHDHGVDDPVAL